MSNLTDIIDINKHSLYYDSNDKETLYKEYFHGKMEFEVSKRKEPSENNIHKAQLYFSLLITPNDYDEPINTFDKDKEKAFIILKFKYNIFYTVSDENILVGDDELLYHFEPYIRKEIFDFCKEQNIPRLPLAIRFWDNAE